MKKPQVNPHTQIKQKFIDYWFGFLNVNKYYIYDTNMNKQLYEISILAGIRGKGVWFSGLLACQIFNIVDELRKAINSNKKFRLHVSYGIYSYLDCTFNKYQQKLLLKELEQIIRTEKIYQCK